MFGLGQAQPVAFSSLNQRCPSPLVLLNNVEQPKFNSGQPHQASSSPFIETQSQPFSQLKSRFQQQLPASTGETTGFNQLPKRTVSLGPRRPLAERYKQNLADSSSSSNKRSPADGNNHENRERRFSRIADELQSSLTELNNLIDAPQTPSQRNSSRLPPKFTSYVTSTPEAEPSFARHCTTASFKPTSPDSPPSGPQPFTWQLDIDPQNWKASSSINDLRSMFEQQKQPANNLSSSTMSLNRPPKSSNSSKLRNSPFHTGEINQQQRQQQIGGRLDVGDSNERAATDYTIRRTISTSGRTSTRNPYRSQYGNS